ncbi:MAG: WD40 repeat domain-containing protein [Streptomyces sp.]|uniref:WD40 repeat domain-containing protein n=1 Tax=Streptomyces sp. TaxID=1931 RepID=UPI003D6A027F
MSRRAPAAGSRSRARRQPFHGRRGGLLRWEDLKAPATAALIRTHAPPEHAPDAAALAPAPVLPTATLAERARAADLGSGEPMPLLPLADTRGRPAQGVAFRRDGMLMAAAYDDGTVGLWDPVSRTLRHRLTGERPLSALAFSPDGSLLAGADKDGAVTVRDAATGRQEVGLPHDGGPLRALAFSPDGGGLLVGGADGTIRLWNLRSGTRVPLLASRGSAVLALSFAADASVLAVGDENGRVSLWEAGADGRELWAGTEPSCEGGVEALAFVSDGTLVAAHAGPPGSGAGMAVTLWRPKGSTPPTVLHVPCRCPVTALALSPDGTLLAAAVPRPAVLRWALSAPAALSP